MEKNIWPRLVLMAAVGLVACVPDPGGEVETKSSRLCGGVLSTRGAIENSPPQPNDVVGCWPVGVWKFRATFEELDCPAPPPMDDEYAIEVKRIDSDEVEKIESYRYLADPDSQNVRLKVSSGGGGLCQATFEFFSEDGKGLLILKPTLEEDRSIAGFGEYDLFDKDQR